jgi:tetratricopeptide (TPR) repeat protein
VLRRVGERRRTLPQSVTADLMLKLADVYAHCGDDGRALKLVAEGTKLRPSDTLLRFVEAPKIRAVLEMNHGRALRALELQRMALPYDRNATESLYTRASAYLQAEQGSQAVKEFERVLALKNYWPPDLIVTLGATGIGARLHSASRPTKGPRRLQRFSHPLERRRPRHPHPERSQGGLREAAVTDEAVR